MYEVEDTILAGLFSDTILAAQDLKHGWTDSSTSSFIWKQKCCSISLNEMKDQIRSSDRNILLEKKKIHPMFKSLWRTINQKSSDHHNFELLK